MRKKCGKLLCIFLAAAVVVSAGDISVSAKAAVSENELETCQQGEQYTEDIESVTSSFTRDKIAREKQKYPESENYTITLPDCGAWKYNQFYARGRVFEYLNKERMNSANWWMRDKDGNRIYLTDAGLSDITRSYIYDYNLEAAAMQRAAEIALVYSNVRPDGISAEEVFSEVKSPSETAQENPYWYADTSEIILLYKTKLNEYPTYWDFIGITDELLEETNSASNQRRRRIVMTNELYRLGIGYINIGEGTSLVVFEMGKDHYDSEYLSKHPDEAGKTIYVTDKPEEVNGYRPVQIRLARTGGNSYVLAENEGYVTLKKAGETFDFKDKYFMPYNGIKIPVWTGETDIMGTWSSTDEKVATVNGTKITAVGEGTCMITSGGSEYAKGVISVKVGSSTEAPLPLPSNEPTEPTSDPVPTSEPTSKPDAPSQKPTSSPVPSTEPSSAPVQKPSEDLSENPSAPATPSAKPSSGSYLKPTGVPAGADEPSGTPQNAGEGDMENADGSGKQTISVAKKFRRTYIIKKKNIKRSKSLKLGVKIKSKGKHGRVSYKIVKYPKGGRKYIKVSKSGKVTLKKGIRKGTYKIRITAAGTSSLKKTTKTVTIKVK